MTIYRCENCKKEFDRKSTYETHIQRKNPCKIDIHINNQCSFCDKKYTTKYNLNVHLKSCEKKQIDDDNKLKIEELKQMVLEQQKNNEELKKKVEELSHATETNNNNINVTENSNNTNTTNNITNNINIYSVGKEDLSLLSKEDVIKLCTSGTYYPIVAAEILHCNDKYPEYQNILISNLRATTGQVKINDKWITRSQDDILNTMMNIDKKHISSLIKDLEVDKKLQVKLESTQDEIDTNQVKEHQKSKIKQRLYDASKMIKENKDRSKASVKESLLHPSHQIVLIIYIMYILHRRSFHFGSQLVTAHTKRRLI